MRLYKKTERLFLERFLRPASRSPHGGVAERAGDDRPALTAAPALHAARLRDRRPSKLSVQAGVGILRRPFSLRESGDSPQPPRRRRCARRGQSWRGRTLPGALQARGDRCWGPRGPPACSRLERGVGFRRSRNFLADL